MRLGTVRTALALKSLILEQPPQGARYERDSSDPLRVLRLPNGAYLSRSHPFARMQSSTWPRLRKALASGL